jgi:hypothetical protein
MTEEMRRAPRGSEFRAYLDTIRDELRKLGPEGRRRRYASPDFPGELLSITRALGELGIPHDLTKALAGFGVEMRTKAQNMSPAEWDAMGYWNIAEKDGKWKDDTDAFFTYFEGLMHEVTRKEGASLLQEVLRQIDSDFAAPVQHLAKLIPDELAESRKYVSEAVSLFEKGDEDGSALRTRKAWESCELRNLTPPSRERPYEPRKENGVRPPIPSAARQEQVHGRN